MSKETGIIETIYKRGQTSQLIEVFDSKHYVNSENDTVYFGPENVLDPTEGPYNMWDSTSQIKNPYIIIHFKSLLVNPKEYSFTQGYSDKLFKSWVVEGSMNNETWFLLDQRDDYELTPINNTYQKIQFPMNESSFNWFRFTFNDPIPVYLSFIELYGTAVPFPYIEKTCNQIHYVSRSCIFIYIAMSTY